MYSLQSNFIRQFQIANIYTDMCLDSVASGNEMQSAVDPYPCHGQGGNQVLYFFILSHFMLIAAHIPPSPRLKIT